MLTKNEVLKTINSLHEKFEAEALIEKNVLLEKLHIGLLQSENGNLISK